MLTCVSTLLLVHYNNKTEKNDHFMTQSADNTTATSILTQSTMNSNTCKEQKSLYFLKVHKAGSTCIQNLFWRFGVSRSLSVMLFTRRSPFHSRDFRTFMLPDPKAEMFQGKYDIFCEHSIFNDVALKDKMKQGTEYSAILRQPLAKLRSALKFFGYVKNHNVASDVDPAEHFLMSDNNNSSGRQTAKEFGYTPGKDIQTFIKDIDSKFKGYCNTRAIGRITGSDETTILLEAERHSVPSHAPNYLCYHKRQAERKGAKQASPRTK